MPPGPTATLMLAELLTAAMLGIAPIGEGIGTKGMLGLVLVFAGSLLRG